MAGLVLPGPVDLTPFALKSDIPSPHPSIPMSEVTAGAVGSPATFAPGSHQHPRLSATFDGTLDATGQKAIVFTRTFSAKPGVSITSEGAGGAVMWDITFAQDASGNYTGGIIRGYRGQKLPPLTAVLTSLVTALSGFDPFATPAAGVSFTGIAVAKST